MQNNTRHIEPKPAATVVVARNGPDGLEVLLLKRTESAVFMPGAFVFPGGAVDAEDADPRLAARAIGLDEAWMNEAMEMRDGALAYVMAALRECFEEAGLLLADIAATGEPVADGDIDLSAQRRRMAGGEVSFAALCEELDLRLHTDRMVYFSRWITPPGAPRRFDARFFLAPAPPGQTAGHDGVETIDHLWAHPRDALERNRRGELSLGSPTLRTLHTLAAFENAEELLQANSATTGKGTPVNAPTGPAGTPAGGASVSVDGRDGNRVVQPGDPAYAEINKLRAEGIGEGGYEIIPGIPRRLSQRVTRLTASNPGMMTGPGTNTYLLDCGVGVAVIDPGPELSHHLENILAAANGPIRWILATHTHPDHSPGTRALEARTGAVVLGMPAPDGDSQDRQFAPDRVPRHGERLELGAITLKAIHTPGHASNHLCYLLEDERLLFSGDHIMQGSTVVISPPDGDMGAYLQALDMLHGEDIAYIAPGHGFLMGEPDAVIQKIIDHRIARETKVIDAARRLGDSTLDDLLPAVYDDVPAALHGVARRSLQAHLIKLCHDGVLQHHADTYAPLD